MSQRSVRVLKGLKDCIVRGALPVERFPVKDVAELIYAEHKSWVDDIARSLNAYETIYNKSISMAVCEKDTDSLFKLIEELISDLVGMSDRTTFLDRERLKELEEKLDWPIIQQYKEYAQKAYEKYSFYTKPLELAFQGKGVIYTVVTGGYDVLCDPEYIDREYDYVCFTDDSNLTSDIWSIRYIENAEKLDQARLSRKYKILCHEFLGEYDYSIYVDGKVQIIGDLRKYVKAYSRGSAMLCFPHFVRECAYEEAKVCAAIGKDAPDVIRKQMEGYVKEGYPVNNGLIDGACLVRKHNDGVLQKVMTCWWDEVKNKSRRDQLSIGYACWKNNFHYDLSDLYTYRNEFLRKSREWEKPY